MKPVTAELTTFLIDQFIEAGQADLVLDLANPLPPIITLDLIDIPRDGWECYADPIHRMVFTRRDHLEYKDVFDGTVWILGQLRELLALRRHEPADDLVTYLIRHEACGTPFTDEELLELLFIIIFGGASTPPPRCWPIPLLPVSAS